MTKKTQAHNTTKTPEEIAQAFMQLWQEKWNETLTQKGWPQGAPMPGIGQMPFFNPFMPMNGFAASPGDAETIQRLEARITALEKKLAIKQATPAPKAKKAAKSKKSKL